MFLDIQIYYQLYRMMIKYYHFKILKYKTLKKFSIKSSNYLIKNKYFYNIKSKILLIQKNLSN